MSGDPIPGIPDGVLDVLPRRAAGTLALEPVPSSPQVLLYLFPAPPHAVQAGLVAVPVCRPKLVVAAPSRVGSRRKLLLPLDVLFHPGSVFGHGFLPGNSWPWIGVPLMLAGRGVG